MDGQGGKENGEGGSEDRDTTSNNTSRGLNYTKGRKSENMYYEEERLYGGWGRDKTDLKRNKRS